MLFLVSGISSGASHPVSEGEIIGCKGVVLSLTEGGSGSVSLPDVACFCLSEVSPLLGCGQSTGFLSAALSSCPAPGCKLIGDLLRSGSLHLKVLSLLTILGLSSLASYLGWHSANFDLTRYQTQLIFTDLCHPIPFFPSLNHIWILCLDS